MGNSNKNTPKKIKSTVPISLKKLEVQITCPNCMFAFAKGTALEIFSQHIRICVMNQPQHQNSKSQIGQLAQVRKSSIGLNKEYFYQKIPLNSQHTKFKWERIPLLKNIDSKIYCMNPKQVKCLKFQQKLTWFRYHLEKLRIPWESGCDWMKIQKTNVLMTSFSAVKNVNMHKQVKINFIGEKVNDAGGLLRQWLHLSAKQIFDSSVGIFVRTNTDQVMYKIRWDKQLDQQFACSLFELFGIIVGKAIFQKIPLECYLDRTLVRQICGGKVTLDDISGYDKSLYTSWKYLIENTVQDLDTYFVIYKQGEDKKIQQIQLIENGKDVMLTDQNKSIYVSLCIQQYCTLSIQHYLKSLLDSIYKIIPLNLLEVFQPYQMEMILYGIPFIDPQEWMKNTQYKGIYNQNHQVIKWFWQCVLNFTQQQLGRLLHFCTGSSRIPLHGFKKLQSNRGNYSKFLIQSSPYQNVNPYPKGHTCFNRLQLPIYPSKLLTKKYLQAIVNNDLDGIYGLD